MVQQYEDFQDNRDIGIIDVGNGEMGRHFIR
jgi:hypothetical protein